MAYNGQHHKTFDSLLKMAGLSVVMAEAISNQLAQIDNDTQDRLIETITREMLKKQNPPQV